MRSTLHAVDASTLRRNTVEIIKAVPAAEGQPADFWRRRPRILVTSAIIAVALGSIAWFGRGPRLHRDFHPHFRPPERPATESPESGSDAPPDTPFEPEPAATEKTAKPLNMPEPPVRVPNPVTVTPPTPPTAPRPAPVVAVDRPLPTPPAPKTPAPSERLPSRTPEEIWGGLVDPAGDCRLLLDQIRHTATLELPGTPHVLSAELRRLNAPRTLQPVSGDFRNQCSCFRDGTGRRPRHHERILSLPRRGAPRLARSRRLRTPGNRHRGQPWKAPPLCQLRVPAECSACLHIRAAGRSRSGASPAGTQARGDHRIVQYRRGAVGALPGPAGDSRQRPANRPRRHQHGHETSERAVRGV